MAGTSPSANRIVPVLSDKKPASRPPKNGPNSLRQRVLKGEVVDRDALKLPCLDDMRLYAAPIKGDGNCLFYSLSDQLYGSPDYHEEIRQRLVDHVRERSDYFISFVPDVGGERRAPKRKAAAAAMAKQLSSSTGREATEEGQRAKFEQMLSQMGKNGIWGGSIELQAFCQAYGKDVFVYSEKGVSTFTGDSAPDDEEREVVHVAYHSFEHYSSVRSIDGPHTGLPRLPRCPWEGLKIRLKINGKWVSGDNLSGETPSEHSSETLSLSTSPSFAEPWKITSIAEALPDLDHETIKAMLSKCRGDVETAFSRLLDTDCNGVSQEDSSSSSTDSNSPSLSGVVSSQSRSTPPTSATFRPSSRAFLGSSSRSSSRHSTASKRSADPSDDDDEGGPIHSANRRRGRDRKRRILQDVTVGIPI
ncbi:hypothetical protein VTO42DRAFT_1243 [Malbranchea cinnamomea]